MTTITVNLANMFDEFEPWLVSNSRANLGDFAGRITWNNAIAIAADHDSWLRSDLCDAVDGMRDWARECGAWDAEEIAAWSVEDCLGLLVQNIASDLRNHLDADNNDLADSCAVYAATDWSEANDSPHGYFYMNDISRRLDPAEIPTLTPMCDFYTGT
jgi:hypothetical protein